MTEEIEDFRLSVTSFERPKHVTHLVPGQMFADDSGDLCIYLGWNPEQIHYGDALTFHATGRAICVREYAIRSRHTVLCYYKRSWISLDDWPKEIKTSSHDLSTLLLQEQPKHFR